MLTPRQSEIALLLADGESDKMIADRLGISVATVRSHCVFIAFRFKSKNRCHLGALIADWRKDRTLTSEDMQAAPEYRLIKQ